MRSILHFSRFLKTFNLSKMSGEMGEVRGISKGPSTCRSANSQVN